MHLILLTSKYFYKKYVKIFDFEAVCITGNKNFHSAIFHIHYLPKRGSDKIVLLTKNEYLWESSGGGKKLIHLK